MYFWIVKFKSRGGEMPRIVISLASKHVLWRVLSLRLCIWIYMIDF